MANVLETPLQVNVSARLMCMVMLVSDAQPKEPLCDVLIIVKYLQYWIKQRDMDKGRSLTVLFSARCQQYVLSLTGLVNCHMICIQCFSCILLLCSLPGASLYVNLVYYYK